ncbi:hypothetical protein PUNSTDRAFT_17680, partial [Punctularia strigosozonata HHB-11173 SS5]|uniref:uncharacterized protein n=1 Tax=Punctularia strigosozonata (strain HHB-11173) TaxID=741275 RepID=UPI0004416C6D
CGHFYDKDCVLDLFQAATRDESLFPPRCCRQHISFDAVRPHMESAQVNAFLEKRKEFSTMKRVYCAAPACSTFLGAQKSQGTIYECNSSTCKTRTCSFCKAKVDELAHICKKNDSEAEVLSVGQREGWTRCPGCEQMIELIIGCYHMTCRCKTEFCYLCRARWKTCSCPQ